MHDPTKGAHLHILSLRVNILTRAVLLEKLKQGIEQNKNQVVVTANPEIALYALSCPDYELAINKEADFIVADGMGLFLAAPFFGQRLPERIVGVDLVSELLTQAQKNNWRVACALPSDGLLTETELKEYFKQNYPDLQADIFSIDHIKLAQQNFSKYQLLLSAHGFPYQENALLTLKEKGIGANIMLGVGASLDFLSGRVRRAPLLMRKMGLEWLFRLINSLLSPAPSSRALSPKRWVRILRAVVVFPAVCVWWIIRSVLFYRPAVVLCLFNEKHDILIAEWHDRPGLWHIPQGGKEKHETFEQSARRELKEEVNAEDVALVKIVPHVYHYNWQTHDECRLWWGYRGQEQTLCYFKLLEDPANLKPDQDELRALRWVSKDELVNVIMPKKKHTAKLVLNHLPYEFN